MKTFPKRSKKLLDSGKFMPPLYHKLPDEEFNIKKSEAVQWLINQPDVLSYVWDRFKQSEDIEYNQETGKWQGIWWGNEDEG